MKTARADIYDWALVPIAKFADSENGSAMTLFGSLNSQTSTNSMLGKGYRVINYHEALDNTLLGLRLMQADLLIIKEEAADLFRKNNRYILGRGERGHDLARNQERFSKINTFLELEAIRGNQFQSYVVGDLDQKVSFGISTQGKLTFTGRPHWLAWRQAEPSESDYRRIGHGGAKPIWNKRFGGTWQ